MCHSVGSTRSLTLKLKVTTTMSLHLLPNKIVFFNLRTVVSDVLIVSFFSKGRKKSRI